MGIQPEDSDICDLDGGGHAGPGPYLQRGRRRLLELGDALAEEELAHSGVGAGLGVDQVWSLSSLKVSCQLFNK